MNFEYTQKYNRVSNELNDANFLLFRLLKSPGSNKTNLSR